MFLPFLDNLRRHGVPVSLREWLDLMKGMGAGLDGMTVEGFHGLARLVLVSTNCHNRPLRPRVLGHVPGA